MSVIPAHLAHLAHTPIESRQQLADYHATGAKKPDGLLIGTEHEKFVLDAAANKVVPYEGPNGILALLQGMQRFGLTPIKEGETLIGLTRSRDGRDENISLEPGGQFELSGAPLNDLHQMSAELDQHFREAGEVARELNLKFLPIGYHPENRVEDMPWMPKGRYKIMREYMPKVGKRGLEMMVLTCTTQVNLDFTDEADMARKMRVGMALQPVASALFAASPFLRGEQGQLSNRCAVWLDVDNARSGILPFVFDSGFGFERYVDYALSVPMYFVFRDGKYIDCSGESFLAFMEGKLPQLPGEKPTLFDYINHLTTLFPDVRLKTHLEMRGADVGRPDMIKALPALWTGLLYDKTALAAAEEMIKDFTVENIVEMRREVTRLGMSSVVAGRNVFSLAKQMVNLSVQGLRRRARRLEGDAGKGGADETRYLEPLVTLVDVEQTEAERLLGLFNGPWDEDIKKIYGELAI